MSDERAVLAANQAFYRAFERKDMAAMRAVWSKGTGSLCIHPGRQTLRGWDAIARSWETIFKNTSYLENELPRRKRTGYQHQKRVNCSSLCS